MTTFVQQATSAEYRSEATVLPTEVDSNHLYLRMACT